MTDINGSGSIQEGRVKIEFDLGFGSLKLDVDKQIFVDEDREKFDIMVDLLESADQAVLQVFNALLDKVEEREGSE